LLTVRRKEEARSSQLHLGIPPGSCGLWPDYYVYMVELVLAPTAERRSRAVVRPQRPPPANWRPAVPPLPPLPPLDRGAQVMPERQLVVADREDRGLDLRLVGAAYRPLCAAGGRNQLAASMAGSVSEPRQKQTTSQVNRMRKKPAVRPPVRLVRLSVCLPACCRSLPSESARTCSVTSPAEYVRPWPRLIHHPQPVARISPDPTVQTIPPCS